MNGRLTFLHCVCLTLAGVLVLALAQGLSGVPPENANARDKGQVKSASRLVTSPVNQVGRQIRNEGGIATAATIKFRWLNAQVGSYPAGTSGEKTADLSIPGAQSAGQPLWLGIYIANWGPNSPATGGKLKNWQAQMDASSLPAGLEPWRPFCPDDDNDLNDPDAADDLCFAMMGPGIGAGCDVGSIDNDECAPAFQDYSRADLIEAFGFPGCNIATDDLKCNGNVGAEANHADPGVEEYGGTFVLLAEQSLVGGPHTIEFVAPGPDTNMNDGLTTVKVNTATLTIESGSCCFGIGGPAGAQCVENISRKDCAGRAPANSFRAGAGSLCPHNGGAACCECFQDSDCADAAPGTPNNQCTDDTCLATCICQHSDIAGWDRDDDCCDPRNGNFSAKDDGDPCTIDTCSDGGDLGTDQHSPAAPGSTCDDGNDCTHTDVCDDQGACAGSDINSESCNTDADCEALVPGVTCCAGFCECAFPTICCRTDGGCDLTCARECVASGGAAVATTCQGDGNGNGVDDACEEVAPIFSCCLGNGTCDKQTFLGCPLLGGFLAPACSENFDENGINDACRADCNGDGLPDVEEPLPAQQDCNLNGICDGVDVDNCPVDDPSCGDCNGNGILDGCESDRDCNENGRQDICDIACGGGNICDGRDGLMLEGSDDCNENGSPDECEVGACCGFERDTGLPACVVTTKGLCDALPIPATFRGPCVDCPAQKTAIFEENGVVFIHSNCPPVGCPPEPSGSAAGAHECGPGPFFDAWVSPAVASMCHNFGAAGGGPIPADFFGPGSDPFDGIVCLEGVPLGPTPFGDFGQADTIIERTDDPFDRCDLPPGAETEVEIEIVALSLVSTDPITVTFNGGQNPEQWDVAVDLSTVTPPAGTLTATKTHCNGGIYTSVVHVQPRFTFTKVGDPTQELGFDTGKEGFDPITLIQDDPAPWVHDVDPNLSYTGDLCSAFHGGIEEANPTTDCDCNLNTVRDKCDVDVSDPDGNGLVSVDCNSNGVPDECELTDNDCNANGVPDECELMDNDCNGNDVPDECDVPPPAGVCTVDCSEDCNQDGTPDECEVDCNQNDVPDKCEIAAGTSADLDGNGIPDECQSRGACCDEPSGVCTNDVTQSDCEGNDRRYGGNGTTCATIDPPCGGFPTIPTVSEWGLVILTLLLLTGAKIYFGHRRAPV